MLYREQAAVIYQLFSLYFINYSLTKEKSSTKYSQDIYKVLFTRLSSLNSSIVSGSDQTFNTSSLNELTERGQAGQSFIRGVSPYVPHCLIRYASGGFFTMAISLL